MDYYGRGPTLRDAEGHMGIDWLSPQLWVMVSSNFSVALAFYGLMSFYHAVCLCVSVYTWAPCYCFPNCALEILMIK